LGRLAGRQQRRRRSGQAKVRPQRGDGGVQLLDVGSRRVAGRVEPAIEGHEVGPLGPQEGREPGREVRAEPQRASHEETGAARTGSGRQCRERVRLVGDAGQQGHGHDAGGDAGLDEAAHRFQAAQRRRRPRLQAAQQRRVERGDADAHGAARTGMELAQHVDSALDQGVLRTERGRGARSGERLEQTAGDAVAALDGLLGVHDGADVDGLAPPAGPAQLVAQHGGSVDLHEEVPLKVGAAVHREGDVRGAGVAIRTGMDTATIGIRTPAEGHGRGDAIEDRASTHLVDDRVAWCRLIGRMRQAKASASSIEHRHPSWLVIAILEIMFQ